MNQTGSSYSFGDFELDLTAYQLKRSGKSIRLERIPFDLLILLIKRPGELITREEIAASLWTERQFQDFETGTNTAIRKLRIALQDDAEKPRFIETAVGRGYRFIAPVEVHRATAPISAATTSPAPSPGAMLAVLPFINLTGDRSQDYFSDGMTEELITQLGRSDGTGLGVIARTSVMPYANTHTPVRQIARELKVDYVLEGSARREGRVVRITAQLIRASDETHLWAKDFDRDIGSVLTLQREVAEAIEREILARIANRPGRASRGTSVDGEAYDLYLQGRRHWNVRTAEGLKKAIEYFERAIGRDPSYAAAYAALADVYAQLAYGNYIAPTEGFSKARVAIAKAKELDPYAAEPFASEGYLKMYFDWDFAGAREAFLKSIELNASYAAAHQWFGILLTAEQQFREALTELQHATRLDPLSPAALTDLGFMLHYNGRNAEAAETLANALQLNPRFPIAHFWLGRVYAAQGECTKALDEFESASQFLPEWQPLLAARGHVCGVCGKREEAEEILRRFHSIALGRFVTSYGIALVYAGLGSHDETLLWLRKAYEERSHWLVWLGLDPRWEKVRIDPRFRALLRDVFGQSDATMKSA